MIKSFLKQNFTMTVAVDNRLSANSRHTQKDEGVVVCCGEVEYLLVSFGKF